MRDSYKVLGIERDASKEEIEDAYATLRNRYKEERFLEGYEGFEAARKLTELDNAYADIIEERGREEAKNNFGSDLGDIDKLIREGKIDQAQSKLDAMADRTAEWHFLQSIIYYKRLWYLESKKQLQMAVSLDPHNEKYTGALNRLEDVMASPINPDRGREETTRPEMGDMDGSGCGTCCASLCLADCCCRMMTCC